MSNGNSENGGSAVTFVINPQRLIVVLRRLFPLYESAGGPYGRRRPKNAEEPIFSENSNLYPPGVRDIFAQGNAEHATYFLLLAALMRGPTKSDPVAESFPTFYKKYRECLRPEALRKVRPEEIEALAKEMKLAVNGFEFASAPPKNGSGKKSLTAKAVVEGMLINLWKIERFYGGNPINLLADCASFSDFCEKVVYKEKRQKERKKNGSVESSHGLYGFGIKMASLLLVLWDVSGCAVVPFHYPLPTDIHAVRVFLQLGVIGLPIFSQDDFVSAIITSADLERAKKAMRLVSLELFEAISSDEDLADLRGITPRSLSDLVWSLSAYNCTKRAPRISVAASKAPYLSPKDSKICHHCPVRDLCGRDVGVAGYHKKGEISVFKKDGASPFQLIFMFR